MKRIIFLATLLPLCIEGQVIEFRNEAVTFFDRMKPAYIMSSNTNRSPNSDRILKERKENRTLLAMVVTKTSELKTFHDAEEKGIRIFGFEDTADIDKIAEEYPKATIVWCYLNDNDE
ncbi:hypothetical protein E3J61_02555 [Candidatus Dependentiae bacterium]|nr:MAG: hypothetical protein E3J61_02555 [Candidatus Dependentiae bacterium]